MGVFDSIKLPISFNLNNLFYIARAHPLNVITSALHGKLDEQIGPWFNLS